MDRRRFLRNLLSGATALAVAPALLRGEDAFAGDPARFAAGLREQPWLAGWKSVQSETLGPATVQLEGRLPAAFAGYLLGALKGSFGWTPAAIMQISGCALIAAILSIMAAKKK